MGITEILSILSALGAIIGAFLTYRYNIRKLRAEFETTANDAEKAFRDDLLARITQLEDNERKLQDERSQVWARAAQERQTIIMDYDSKIDSLRKDTRRQLDEMILELSTWRDRYYTLYGEYEKLKIEHIGLEARFTAAQRELDQLKAQFKNGS